MVPNQTSIHRPIQARFPEGRRSVKNIHSRTFRAARFDAPYPPVIWTNRCHVAVAAADRTHPKQLHDTKIIESADKKPTDGLNASIGSHEAGPTQPLSQLNDANISDESAVQSRAVQDAPIGTYEVADAADQQQAAVTDCLQSAVLTLESQQASDNEEGSEDEYEDDEDWSDLDANNAGMLTEEELLAQNRAFEQSVLTSEKDSATHRAGYVALVGRPNAGKSTMLNALLRQKLSAVTAKAQTTRHRILGIVSEDDYQLILLDTPGVIQSQTSSLDRKMMHNVNTAVQQADAILVIVDATSDLQDVLQMPGMAPGWRGPPAALVLNKADMLKPAALHAAGDWLRSRTAAAAIFPASAVANRGLTKVESWAVQQLPLGPALYPKDSVSEQSERFFVAEIVREQIFLQYRQEVPYCVAVLVTEFKERISPHKDYVQVTLLVESDSQRPIILGTKGSAIKELSTSSRIAIEEFLERKIFLDITVRTEKNWRRNEKLLDTIGY